MGCRLSFARSVLKLELVARSLGMPIVVGEKAGEKYVFNFRSVEPNPEGGSAGGSEDPFEIPDGGAVMRIEREQEKMKAQIENFQEKIQAQLGEIHAALRI